MSYEITRRYGRMEWDLGNGSRVRFWPEGGTDDPDAELIFFAVTALASADAINKDAERLGWSDRIIERFAETAQAALTRCAALSATTAAGRAAKAEVILSEMPCESIRSTRDKAGMVALSLMEDLLIRQI